MERFLNEEAIQRSKNRAQRALRIFFALAACALILFTVMVLSSLLYFCAAASPPGAASASAIMSRMFSRHLVSSLFFSSFQA